MYTTPGQVTELNLMVVASSYRKIAPGVRKVVLIGGWYRTPRGVAMPPSSDQNALKSGHFAKLRS